MATIWPLAFVARGYFRRQKNSKVIVVGCRSEEKRDRIRPLQPGHYVLAVVGN